MCKRRLWEKGSWGGIRKGSEWWNGRVKMKVEEKKRAYEAVSYTHLTLPTKA